MKMNSLKIWFSKLSFWKKLIIIFTINTLVILFVMDCMMHILYNQVSNQIQSISDEDKAQFNTVSNLQVVQSATKMILTSIDLYSDFIIQFINCFSFFSANKSIYQSLQSGTSPTNPSLTSSFTSPDYQSPGIYYFANSSTFYDDSYIDVILAKLFGSVEIAQIKRLNIIYQSLNDSQNIFARTLPGTNDFIISSVQDISSRFEGLSQGFVTLSGVYNDTLSVSNPPETQKLVAIRSVLIFPTVRVLLQLQFYQYALEFLSSRIYYFPDSELVMIKLLSKSPLSFQLMNSFSSNIDIQHFLDVGQKEVLTKDGRKSILGSTTSFNSSFQIGTIPSISNNASADIRIVLLVPSSQVQAASMLMDSFLQTLQTSILSIIYGWSFILILVTIGLAIVVGDYVFLNLKTLSTKMQEYIRDPKSMHKITVQLKQLQTRGVIKKLIDNVIIIIERIQTRKKNDFPLIQPIKYPMNLAQKQFLKRHGINDQQKFKRILQLIQKKNRQKQGTFQMDRSTSLSPNKSKKKI